MRKTITTASIFVTIGLVAFLLIRGRSSRLDSNSGRQAITDNAHFKSTSPRRAGEKPPKGRASSRSREQSNELKLEFGESRTNLSKKVSDDIVKIVMDVLEIDGVMVLDGAEDDPRSLFNQIDHLPGFAGAGLDADQKRKLAGFLAESMRRKEQKRVEFAEAAKSDPSELMEYLLLDDAAARNVITSEEAKNRQKALKMPIGEILDGLDFKNVLSESSPLNDPQFDKEVAGILNQEQYSKWKDRNASVALSQIRMSEEGEAVLEPSDHSVLLASKNSQDHPNLEDAEKDFSIMQMTVSGLKDVLNSQKILLKSE